MKGKEKMRELNELLTASISSMTTRELKKYIRYQTGLVNLKISEYDGDNVLIKSEISELKALGGNVNAKKVGLGLTFKTKAELQRQARELSYFNRWDYETAQGKRELSRRERQSFETFHKHHPEYSYEEWKDLVNTMGALGSSVVSQFGSENIAEINKTVYDKGRNKDVLKAMQTVIKEQKGKGATPELLNDELWKKLNK